jgi:hypothetical protein
MFTSTTNGQLLPDYTPDIIRNWRPMQPIISKHNPLLKGQVLRNCRLNRAPKIWTGVDFLETNYLLWWLGPFVPIEFQIKIKRRYVPDIPRKLCPNLKDYWRCIEWNGLFIGDVKKWDEVGKKCLRGGFWKWFVEWETQEFAEYWFLNFYWR